VFVPEFTGSVVVVGSTYPRSSLFVACTSGTVTGANRDNASVLVTTVFLSFEEFFLILEDIEAIFFLLPSEYKHFQKSPTVEQLLEWDVS
jgi:hypothetical protein